MKNHIYILSLFCASACFGQVDTKEDFVNEIYHTVVDRTYRYYYLDTNARAIYWRHEKGALYDTLAKYKGTTELLESVALTYPEVRQISGPILEELYNKANTDTLRETWNFAQLNRAKATNVNEWVKLKKHKLFSRKEKQNIFFFSKPIFNSSKEYAIISMTNYCGDLCAGRCIYLFKKNIGTWEEIAHFGSVSV